MAPEAAQRHAALVSLRARTLVLVEVQVAVTGLEEKADRCSSEEPDPLELPSR